MLSHSVSFPTPAALGEQPNGHNYGSLSTLYSSKHHGRPANQ